MQKVRFGKVSGHADGHEGISGGASDRTAGLPSPGHGSLLRVPVSTSHTRPGGAGCAHAGAAPWSACSGLEFSDLHTPLEMSLSSLLAKHAGDGTADSDWFAI